MCRGPAPNSGSPTLRSFPRKLESRLFAREADVPKVSVGWKTDERGVACDVNCPASPMSRFDPPSEPTLEDIEKAWHRPQVGPMPSSSSFRSAWAKFVFLWCRTIVALVFLLFSWGVGTTLSDKFFGTHFRYGDDYAQLLLGILGMMGCVFGWWFFGMIEKLLASRRY